MVQVAAWFVAGVAWPAAWVLYGTMQGEAARCKADPREPKDVMWTALVLWLLSSGVAVAATAVALGVGR